MAKKTKNAAKEPEKAALALVDLLLAPYDDLVEVDTNCGRMRALRHAEGKYFVPVVDTEVEDMLRYSAEFMIHPDEQELYISFNDPTTMAQRMKESNPPGLMRARFRYRLLEGGWRWVEQVNVGGREQGLPDGVFYAILYDIEERDRWEATRAKSVPSTITRNALTGLLWEEQFFQRAKPLIEAHSDDWCMLAFDLEHFKLFNEWYGRKKGDMLLAQIGAKLRQVEDATGGLGCYVGQDDFCLLAPYDRENIERLFNEIHALIRQHGTSVGFLPAFGIAPLSVNGAISAEELYDRASLATHRAKESFHTRICIFDPGMFERTEKDYQILSDFQDAMENHEMYFVLQPQCNIATGKVVGAESLVRWRKADGTMVSPGVFVPVLEEYGFITEMDSYIWDRVCVWQKEWIDDGHTPLPVSVNVSQADISAIDVPEFFGQLMEKYKLPTDVIKIEITESAYVDNDKVVDAVYRLREMGFLVLMDDFGSGYSSLNMLRNLNVDVLKLDAQFLRMSGDDKRKGVQIMETIVNMAKTMNVPIIVEGVETKEESDFLARLGCRYVQGYLFYRPMPVTDFERLIVKADNVDNTGFRFKARQMFHTREFLDTEVFSDTVLNNILGPVAFFLWHGDEVDILRMNQQFFNEFKLPSLHRYMKGFQEALVRDDVQALYQLLDRAVMNPLSGAEQQLRFNRPDGGIAQFRMHFYFLEQDEGGKRFYCSVRDMTERVALSDHLRLLSRVATDSVIFARRQSDGSTVYQVAMHGLEEDLGMDRQEMEAELNDGRFFQRVAVGDRARFARLNRPAGDEQRETDFNIRVAADTGCDLDLMLHADDTHERKIGVDYVISLRKADD